jgi:hypothetical protein
MSKHALPTRPRHTDGEVLLIRRAIVGESDVSSDSVLLLSSKSEPDANGQRSVESSQRCPREEICREEISGGEGSEIRHYDDVFGREIRDLRIDLDELGGEGFDPSLPFLLGLSVDRLVRPEPDPSRRAYEVSAHHDQLSDQGTKGVRGGGRRVEGWRNGPFSVVLFWSAEVGEEGKSVSRDLPFWDWSSEAESRIRFRSIKPEGDGERREKRKGGGRYLAQSWEL